MREQILDGPKIKVVGAVVHAVALLRVLAASPKPIGASAAAREAKINTSTAFNILRTLTVERLVSFDAPSKTYRLASGIFELAKSIGHDLSAVIKAELGPLSERTGCLIVLWEVMGDRVILADRAVPDRPVGLNVVTRRMPLMLGAVGRAMTAALHLSDVEIKKQFAKLRWQGPITIREYIADVRQTEVTGYAIDVGQLYLGITSIAAVVTDQSGAPVYGISAIDMSSLLDELKIDNIGAELARVARALSAPAIANSASTLEPIPSS